MLSILSHAARRATPEKFRARPWVVGRQNLTRAQISDADDVLELLWLLFTAVQAVVRPRHDLVIENLLLRHQLAVLTRPTRRRPHVRLRLWDKLLWILARRFYAGWRQSMLVVRERRRKTHVPGPFVTVQNVARRRRPAQ